MPNWVFNKVHFYGNPEKIKEMRNFMETENNPFDFNKLIPMPEELNMTCGSDETIAIECATARRRGQSTCDEYEKFIYNQRKTFDEWADIGEKYLSNKEKYGYTTWYGWCCANWGTKWNACDAIWNGDDFVSFNTAWSVPLSIYEQLYKRFPEVSFEVEYADEDLGNNCGCVSWNPEGSFYWEVMDDFDFACEVWGYDPDEMREEMYE